MNRVNVVVGDVTTAKGDVLVLTYAQDFYGADAASSQKPHVFVAMPYSKGKMEDVYGFGIQGAVTSAGYLCERVVSPHSPEMSSIASGPESRPLPT